MNLVTLLGRIGQQPEIKYTQSGMAVCNFSLATNKKIKGEDVTSWHRCVAFDKTAELIGKYIGKGDQLGIEGEIKYGSYDKDGNTIYTTDIVVNRIHFVGGKRDGTQNNQNQGQGRPQNQQQGGYQGGAQNQGNYQGNQGGGQQIPDDDIPF